MSSLPPDLIFEILSYLPSKSLLRFRSVSKQFSSLIDDLCFVRLHCRRSRASLFALNAITMYRGRDNVDLSVILTDQNNETIHEFARTFHRDRVRIIGSNHQFLCFVFDKTVSLYDPTHRDFLKLPTSPSSMASSPHRVSFGFIESTMQYKVVRWFFLQSNPTIVFEVLTLSVTRDCRLEISPWRLSERHFSHPPDRRSHPVHAEGYVYWTTTDLQIASFSLQDETLSVLPPPPCFPTDDQRLLNAENAHNFKLYGIRGKLWVADYDNLELIIDIWMRSDDKSSVWAKIHRIELKGTTGFSP